MASRILVTGGAGFIGSHTCLVLLEAGYDLLIVDNFSNSSSEALARVASLAQVPLNNQRLQIEQGDIRDPQTLDQLFSDAGASGRPFDAVIHFAGLKAVGESIEKPLLYWDVNVSGSRTLLAAMDAYSCRTLSSSSSATVYGFPKSIPIPESTPVQPINPYSFSKAAVEQMLADLNASAPNTWRIATLRYFNPVGATQAARSEKTPSASPTTSSCSCRKWPSDAANSSRSLAATGPPMTAPACVITSTLWISPKAHQAALETLLNQGPQQLTCNLGSGDGASVDVISAFSTASGQDIPYTLVNRRAGDAAITVADPSRAAALLQWRSKRTLIDICRDGWAWQQANPMGYEHSA